MPKVAHVGSRFSPPQQLGQYPLQGQCSIWGLCAALISVGLFGELLAGFAILVLFMALGAVWRQGEPPILSFCLGYQWICVATGYFYHHITGFYPGRSIPGDMEGATLLSLLGFLTLVLGIRTAFYALRRRIEAAERNRGTLRPIYDVRRLFWFVIAVYTVNWFTEILPRAIFFNAAEIISNALEFRGVLLCLLIITILRQGDGYGHGAIAFLYALLPQFISGHARFSELCFYLFVLLFGEWRPSASSLNDRRHNLRLASAAVIIAVAVSVMGFIWQEAVKSTWRGMLLSDEVRGTPIQKLAAFSSLVQRTVSGYELSVATETGMLPGESLAERLWGTYNFSHVLQRVPEVVPHENGILTQRAVEHVIKPRFLFPDKPNLGSNSWLVRQYAGLDVAGAEEGTSIGFGYMAQFYVDFGSTGMFVPVFLWGMIAGLVYGAMFLVVPSHRFACAAVPVLFIQPFAGDAEISYVLGGLLNRLVVFSALFYFLGRWLERHIQLGRSTNKRKILTGERAGLAST